MRACSGWAAGQHSCIVHMWAVESSHFNLHALWMQVRRHLKGERTIPNKSDEIQVWRQEYKVLSKIERLVQESEDIMIAAQT